MVLLPYLNFRFCKITILSVIFICYHNTVLGSSNVAQVFRQICEKYLGKGKDVYFAFLDLEKVYDRVDRDAMWNVLRLNH